MGFLDNVRSRFKNNDEEEFERAFHEGAWPEGVEDFAPLENTGSFLPATYEVDPLADASLPGNVLASQGAGSQAGADSPAAQADFAPDGQAPAAFAGAATESVVRSAATAIYAAPVAESPFQVIDATLRPRSEGAQAAPAAASPATDYGRQAAYDRPSLAVVRPSGDAPAPDPSARFDSEDEGVQVVARRGADRAGRAPAPHVEQKPFADRLRERVAAANVSGQTDEMLGRSQAAVQQPGAKPVRRNENASAAELDAELEERRRSRRAAEQARAQRDADRREREDRIAPVGVSEPQRRGTPFEADKGSAMRPVPVSCIVIRPRVYDDVRDVAQGVLAERRPVVLMLRGCSNDLARRVLDFSFGMCCASGAGIREFGDHVYAVLPRDTALTSEDMVSLRRQGIVR